MSESNTRASVKVAGVLIPVVIVLVLMEVVVRVTGLASPDHRMIYADEVVKGRPNATYVNQREHRCVVRLNNYGFHDRDWHLGDGVPKILFLGDSMVEGIQVPVDSLFTSILGDELRADGENVDVLNAGVSGTGTGHEYLLWKTFIHDVGVRPAHTILCLFPQNDLKNNGIELGRGPEDYGVYLGPGGEPFVYKSHKSVVRLVVRRLIDHSALLNLIYTRLHYLRYGLHPGEEEVAHEMEPAGGESAAAFGEESMPSDFDPDEAPVPKGGTRIPPHPDFAAAGAESLWAESMSRTLELIYRWDREAESEGQKFSVVIVPSVDRNNYYEDELGRRLLAAAADGRLDVLMLTMDGLDPIETNSFNGRTLGHFNPLGHRIAARELRRWLEPGGGGDDG